MSRRLLTLLLVFFLGALGGLWAQAFLLPWLAANPAFANLQFVRDWNSRTQIVSPVEQIFVRENEAVERLVEKARASSVAIRSQAGQNSSGLVYTSDGLIVALASLVPQGYGVVVYDGQEALPAQVLKRDLANNLALLKVEKTGLQTAGFTGNGGVALGEKIILVGKVVQRGEAVAVVNEGVVKKIDEGIIATSMTETAFVNGAPLFTLEGRVAGLAAKDPQGSISAIPASVLRAFLGL